MKTKEELETELSTLKAKHKTVYSLSVYLEKDDENFATIFLKPVDSINRIAINAALDKKGGIASIEVAIRNLYLGGDNLNLIVGNDYATISCEEGVIEILKVKKGVLKKN